MLAHPLPHRHQMHGQALFPEISTYKSELESFNDILAHKIGNTEVHSLQWMDLVSIFRFAYRYFVESQETAVIKAEKTTFQIILFTSLLLLKLSKKIHFFPIPEKYLFWIRVSQFWCRGKRMLDVMVKTGTRYHFLCPTACYVDPTCFYGRAQIFCRACHTSAHADICTVCF